MTDKHKVSGQMRVRVYEVLVRAIDEGVSTGMHRAHKHTDTPTREAIEDAVSNAVVDAICEVFSFDDEQPS